MTTLEPSPFPEPIGETPPPEKPSSWPTVIGIISIILGILGALDRVHLA